MDKNQAQEVISQIGRMTLMAVGAREFSLCNLSGNEADKKLRFRITISRNVLHWIEVVLTAADDYTVTLLTQKRDRTIVPVQKADGVYCDQISEVIYRMGSPKGQGQSYFEAVGIKAVTA